jgi:hypothetical protein
MRSLIAAALILGIVLLSLLFYASSDSAVFSDSLPSLFLGGGILGMALLVLLGWRCGGCKNASAAACSAPS